MTFNISSMLKPEAYDHPAKNIKLIETHISWVILTGNYAYKIKKPVNFGFLNFSTLEKRHNYCKQELKLNRRLAPTIYLEVVAIAGTQNRPVISGSGDAFEYAVKMTQFPQSAQLDNMLADGELNTEHMNAIANMVANFHQSSCIADDTMEYGSKAVLYQPVEENFAQIEEHLDTAPYTEKLDALSHWCSSEFIRLGPMFEQRKRDGYIRECHGDMHLRNLLWLDDQAIAFDCIEFNAKLRWIDVISEVAFLVMDLQNRKQQQLANHFLNKYLEVTGDYAGLSILPFYLCYRALVRAKVNALRLQQNNLTAEEKNKTIDAFEAYLELALTFCQQTTPKLIIMHGPSASGKSTVSQKLLDNIGAIRIRSDVERKRLFDNISTSQPSSEIDTNINTGIYSEESSRQTYKKLIELSSTIIKAGYSVIVDAAFLKRELRKPFKKLAETLKTPYIILEVNAPEELLKQRIKQRKNNISDADISVLKHQLSHWQPLHEKETSAAIQVNTSEELDVTRLINKINTL